MAATGDESAYLALVQKILDEGDIRHGRNGVTKSLFGERLEFHLNGGTTFPLLTTKRVFWRGVVEELLWFLRGSTDATELQRKGVHIWDGNSSRDFLDSVGLQHVPEGHIGLGYGHQWRNFNGTATKKNGVDQLAFILEELRSNPHGRRCILSAWNPCQLREAALPPCHVTYQFYVDAHGLSCQMFQRSVDTMAGMPFNIASTACFTMILAHILGVPAHRVILVTGDTHIYEAHWDNARIQVDRTPHPPPAVRILKEAPAKDASISSILGWIESLTFEDFELDNYAYHFALYFPMIA